MSKIPFNLFGEEQHLEFDLQKLEDFEIAIGKGVQQIIRSEDEGIHFCLKALPFCLKKMTKQFYINKIEEHLESGGTLDQISSRIIHAIFATGILGKGPVDAVMAIYYPELYPQKIEDSAEKNE